MKLNYRDVMKLSTKDDFDWRITGKFDERAWPRHNPHTGTDFGMDVGTPIYAMADAEVVAENNGIDFATVKSTGSLTNDYGNWTMYYVPSWDRTYLDGHTQLGQSAVKVGQILKQGDLITKSGNTGVSSGPHLHRTVAPGRHTTLQSLFSNAIDFVKDTPGVNETEVVPGPEGLKPYLATIPAGATLYDRNGSAYSKPTTAAHEVKVYEEVGDLRGFSASWLQGVSAAYFKVGATPTPPVKPTEPAKPVYKDRNGSIVTIAATAALRDANDNVYPVRTTRDQVVTVTGQVGDGISGKTLLKFSAKWLQGVSHAYVRLENVK